MADGWQQSGRQRYRLEGDIILSRWSGACTEQELEPFLAFAEKVLARLTHPFLLIDNTYALPGLPAVRRRVVTWARTHTFAGGVAIFGSDWATRAIGMLMLNAIALLKRTDLNKRIIYVREENEARAWVDQRRVLLRTMMQAASTASEPPAP